MVELKPCPFDGCKDIYCEEIDGLWGVICTKCDCVGPIHETKEQAIDAWNKRSQEDNK